MGAVVKALQEVERVEGASSSAITETAATGGPAVISNLATGRGGLATVAEVATANLATALGSVTAMAGRRANSSSGGEAATATGSGGGAPPGKRGPPPAATGGTADPSLATGPLQLPLYLRKRQQAGAGPCLLDSGR